MHFVSKHTNELLKELRWNNWWYSFIPFISGLVYLSALSMELELNMRLLLSVILFIVSAIGFASLGYSINEYFDKNDDIIAGKRSSFLISDKQRLLFILISALIAISPWIFLPIGTYTYFLIILEITLFLLYSAPPFRLKKTWWLAGWVDAAYAYVVPFWLIFHTFSLFIDYTFSRDIVLLFTTALYLTGFRNITVHQLKDISGDKKTGTITLPLRLGLHPTKVILWLILAIEVIIYPISLFYLSFVNPFVVVLIAFFIIFLVLRTITLYQKNQGKRLIFLNVLTDEFYQVYAPLICLLLLISYDLKWSFLFFIHLALFFRPELKELFFDLVINPLSMLIHTMNKTLHFIWSISSTLVNYFLFYLFLIAGVNLRKENKSAAKYLEDKFD